MNQYSNPTTYTEIARNKVVISSEVDFSIAQGIRCFTSTSYEGELLLHNNMVSMNLGPAPDSRSVRGITVANERATLTEIAHNSVFLPANQVNNEELGRTFHAIGADGASSNTLTVANNMTRTGTHWSSAFYYHSGTTLQADGNVMGIAGEAVAVASEDTTYTVLADWQANSGLDVQSQTFDPLSSWASPEDLHLVNSVSGLQPGSINILKAPLATDFDGDPRSASSPTPGADEVDLEAAIHTWKLYGDN